jgi:hypothetical protein
MKQVLGRLSIVLGVVVVLVGGNFAARAFTVAQGVDPIDTGRVFVESFFVEIGALAILVALATIALLLYIAGRWVVTGKSP